VSRKTTTNQKRETRNEKRIIIAGGGTGGHLFPGIAIARELKKRFDEIHILFVVGRRKMERELVVKTGFEARSIDAEGMLGKGLLKGVKALYKVLISSIQSFTIMRDFKPHLIVLNGRFAILVMGGSQGARAINRAVVSALRELKTAGLVPFVIHQTGKEDLRKVIGDYHGLGLDGEVKAFIEDMASAYARADLVICRAGATTIAELAALGKPSILIPYPYAAHKHQDINARALVGTGGADMIPEKDLNGQSLARKVRRYMENREELARMSSLALEAGRPRAKEIIADELMELIRSA